jgi:hypothetical protein
MCPCHDRTLGRLVAFPENPALGQFDFEEGAMFNTVASVKTIPEPRRPQRKSSRSWPEMTDRPTRENYRFIVRSLDDSGHRLYAASKSLSVFRGFHS